MKKILINCMILVTMGAAEEYTQADRILDMQRMAQAMQDIQSGFFYNNLDIVKAGTQDLKSTIVKIKPIKSETETTDVYEKWFNDSVAITKRTQKEYKDMQTTLSNTLKQVMHSLP